MPMLDFCRQSSPRDLDLKLQLATITYATESFWKTAIIPIDDPEIERTKEWLDRFLILYQLKYHSKTNRRRMYYKTKAFMLS